MGAQGVTSCICEIFSGQRDVHAYDRAKVVRTRQGRSSPMSAIIRPRASDTIAEINAFAETLDNPDHRRMLEVSRDHYWGEVVWRPSTASWRRSPRPSRSATASTAGASWVRTG